MNVIALMLAAAAFVWLIPMIRSGRLLILAMAVLVLGTVLGPNFFAIDGPVKISIDRVLFALVLAFAVIGCRLGVTEFPRMQRMDWLCLAIAGWFGFSAIAGGSDPPGTPPVARWLFYVAMPIGMYFLARVVRVRSDDVRWWQFGMIGLGLYLAVTAVLEIRGLHGWVFPRYIVDAEAWEFFGRGRGPLMNPSGNGFVIAIALGATVVAFLQTSRDRKVLFAVVGCCLLAGIYATLTRSAWLGGVATVAVVGLIHSSRTVRMVCLSGVLLVGLVAVTGAKDQLLQMKRDQNLSAADAEKSVKLRPLLAIVAWEMFKDRPLAGHGYGHYFAKHQPYHQHRGYGMPLRQARPYAQHNVFLSVLVDTGLIGLTLFLAWFLSIAAIAWRLARDLASRPERRGVGLILLSTMTAYVCNGMFQDVMIIPMVHMFLFFAAGLAVSVEQLGLELAPAQRRGVSVRAPASVRTPA